MHSPHDPIHARDFAPMRQQRSLAELTGDSAGWVRLSCSQCPRQAKVALSDLRQRFAPREGLVNVLNILASERCARTRADASGTSRCGLRYRDLR